MHHICCVGCIYETYITGHTFIYVTHMISPTYMSHICYIYDFFHGSLPYMAHLAHICHMSTCMAHIWHIYCAYMMYANKQHTYMRHLQTHVCRIYNAYMSHICDIYNTYVAYIMPICRIYAVNSAYMEHTLVGQK